MAVIDDVGGACFGVVTGYITYRTLARTVDKTAISDLAAVVAVIGGAAVTRLFKPHSAVFAWYSIGLLVGMAAFFLLFLKMNGKAETARVMGAPVLDGVGAAPVAPPAPPVLPGQLPGGGPRA